MQTIGDALGVKWRDILVTDTAIRTRMRLRHPGLAAVTHVNAYVERKNQANNATPRLDANGTRTVRSKKYSSTWFTADDDSFIDIAETRAENNGGDVSTRLDLAGGLLEIQVDVQRKMDAAASISLATPSILRTLASDENVGLREAENDDPIVAHPIDLYRGNSWLLDRIFRQNRTLAILAIGWPVLLDEETIHRLAQRLCGLAHVVVCRDDQISYDLSDSYGKNWSVYHSAIRLYGAGITVADDPRRASRMILRDRYWTQDPADVTRMMDDMVMSAGRYVQTRLVDCPMPSREVAIERARKREADRVAARLRTVTKPEHLQETPVPETLPEAEPPAPAPIDEAYRERLAEMQAEIDAFRKTNSLLTDEHEFQKQLAESYEKTARSQQEELDRLRALVEPVLALNEMTDAWRGTIVQLIDKAIAASDLERHNDDLKETVANLQSHRRLLEHGAAAQAGTAPVALPKPQNIESLLCYLGTKYPGVFSIFGQGSRSYKKTDTYDNQERFLEALDVLGTHYYAWKTATGTDVLERQRAFEERCTALSLKNTPSATTQGYNVYRDEHTVLLSGGRKTQMYELRDVGTTMEQRHMLYLGYAWDDEAGQVVIARFDHPIVLSART